ncbi:MAG: DUF2142 domain-containing protein [Clostridia bacterium]|nr:DUF2142 domain-containing protein [Clostridia bacterium]
MSKFKEKVMPCMKKAGQFTWELLKRNIRVFYVILVLIFALLIISFVSTKIAYDVDNVTSFDKEITGLGVHGYTTSIDENQNVTYTPINNDPQLYFTLGDKVSFNTITLHFKSPVASSSFVQVYYSYTGEELSEPHSVKSRISSDGMSVSLVLPKTTTYELLRVDVNSTFTLDEISLETTTLVGMQKSANVGVIIAFIILVAILAGVERWFGFYRWIWSLIKTCYLSARELLTNKKYASFVIRVLFILSAVTLVVSYTIILMTATMTTSLITYIFIMSAVFVILFIADRVLSGNINAPIMFLIITIACGFMIASTLPVEVSNGWDEEYHYARCVDMKMFLFGNEETYADTWQAQRLFPLTTDRYLYNTDDFIFDLIDMDQIKSRGVVPKNIDLYKLLGHIPGAVAMAGADLTDLNYVALFIIARMANVLTYAFVIYLGLKRLKSGALIFSSICLMPTALFIASVFSYDYFITAFVCYAFSYFISELQNPDKKFTLKDGILMLGAMVVGCGPKAIYLVLIFPMLFMSKKKFNTKRGSVLYRVACVCSMLILVVTFILPYISNTASGVVGGDYRGGSDVDTTQQTFFIFNNPWTYTKILLQFLGEYVSFANSGMMAVSYSYVGNAKLIWGTLALCIMAFCAFTDKSEYDDFKGSTKMKAITIFTCFGVTCLVATALYLTFTPVGRYTILGCQWRYIIPILIPFLYCVGSSKVSHRMDKRVINALVFGALALNIFMTFYDVYISKIIPLP